MLQRLANIGDHVLYYFENAGRLLLFLINGLVTVFKRPYDLHAVARQIYFIGARSTFLILVSGVFTGMVLSLQFYNTMERFGSVDLLGSAVGIALLRELGPVMAGLMVIGRAGSAMCAEIGIMRTTEQVDALTCMAIDPYKYLIAPKLVAGLISLPLLTAIFNVLGIFGAWLVATSIFGINSDTFLQSLYDGVDWNDVEMSLIKAAVFGLLITWIATAKGFFLHLEREGAFGAEGVSRVTTNAVVLASIALLFADYLVGAIML
jgi:phospholipid/cholesterol/gamma-HCH transport system permease protein